LYKCKSFGRQFVGGFRLDDEVLKSEYIEGNQTLDQFASKYNVNKSTIGRRFKSMCHVHVISRHKEVVINMDTTYWGRNFGLMVIKDSFRNKILWHKFVRTETITDYLKGVEFLRSHGFIIHGIVCDGLRGLFQSLRQYKVQMCQFHQIMIIRHYLTKK
ncbi:IS256 family transposase, variant Zn-binding type, partial [Barnesiella intestinihominis]